MCGGQPAGAGLATVAMLAELPPWLIAVAGDDMHAARPVTGDKVQQRCVAGQLLLDTH
jgi:hypothetical protein